MASISFCGRARVFSTSRYDANVLIPVEDFFSEGAWGAGGGGGNGETFIGVVGGVGGAFIIGIGIAAVFLRWFIFSL